jgi:DNA polymerase I-like protein with 3'-5' exonuclease and polymerase domains
MRILGDTESNGFVANATKIHCSCFVNVDTFEEWDFRPGETDKMVSLLDQADMIIGHNWKRHDGPLITKLTGWKPRPSVSVMDTMILSRLIFPNLKATDKSLILRGKMPPGRDYQGRHTIGAWGYRLGEPKGDYAQLRRAQALAQGITDEKAILAYVWGEWNEDMHEYMLQDRKTGFALWKHLRPHEYATPPIELEHRVARVCDAMEQAGVPFDLKAAAELQVELVSRKDVLERKLKATYGYWYAPVSPNPTKALFVPKKADKKKGYWGDTEDITDLDGHVVGKKFKGYPCTKIKQVMFNPGSGDHLAKVLLDRGWKPTKFTDGGKPQMDEEVIEGITARFPEMEGLAELLMINKRLSQLVGGKSSKYPLIDCVKEDGCIHGVINPMGTITSRGAHMFPNLGQVPSAKKPYGVQFRRLFYARKGWKFIGADMQGLELRALAHYLHKHDGGAYAKTVIEGDPHWLHAVVMGLAEGERDKHNKLHTVVREDGSKRFIYAYIYGCGDEMAGSIIYEALLNARRSCGEAGESVYAKFFGIGPVGEPELRKVGKTVRNAFLTRIDGFGKLQGQLSKQVAKLGRVPGLDGRRIPTRSEHSALNFMLQSAGAILCKRWLADAFEECCDKLGYNWEDPWSGNFVFVLWVHDEIQVCVREGFEKEVGDILVACARKAGEPYGFRVPLDSAWEAGANWADTH